jgi:hypothetical protein
MIIIPSAVLKIFQIASGLNNMVIPAVLIINDNKYLS